MLPVALEMMTVGMRVDVEALRSLSAHCLELMQQEAEVVAKIAGYGLNPNSDKQVRELVYDKLGFKPTKKTKVAQEASTNDKELSKVKHPVIAHIIEYRKIAKVRDSYAEKLPKYTVLDVHGNSIIHCTIRVTGTDTGRLKVTDPPLQTLPVRTELGKRVRKAFVARPGHAMVFVDLSQIEMRVLAHVSNCRNLIDLFNRGGDIHTDTAVNVFGISREAAKEDKYRKPIKNVNFGVVYGISPQGLYNLMIENGLHEWTLRDCEKLIVDYFALYPEIYEYTKNTVAYATEHGYVIDMFGRRRIIPEIDSPFEYVRSDGYRQAGNGPIQMGAQGILKLATNRIYAERGVMPFKFLMQVHDELIVECPLELVIPVAEFVKTRMETTTKLSIPILAEAKAGLRWGADEIPL
jgi:DNA polymerase I